jgi:hypothetical protein
MRRTRRKLVREIIQAKPEKKNLCVSCGVKKKRRDACWYGACPAALLLPPAGMLVRMVRIPSSSAIRTVRCAPTLLARQQGARCQVPAEFEKRISGISMASPLPVGT